MRIASKLIAALAIIIAIPVAASAAPLNCQEANITKTVLVQNNTTTSSTSAVNIAGAVLEGLNGENECVYVEYTAQFKAPAGARISLVVTGLSPAPSVFPPTQDLSTAGTGFDTKTVAFELPKVLSTSNVTFQVRIQSLASGQPVIGGRGVLRVRKYSS